MTEIEKLPNIKIPTHCLECGESFNYAELIRIKTMLQQKIGKDPYLKMMVTNFNWYRKLGEGGFTCPACGHLRNFMIMTDPYSEGGIDVIG